MNFELRSQAGLIGLDLATTTGFSYAAPGELPAGGVWKLPALSDEPGSQPAGLRDCLKAMIEFYRPRCIAAEASIMVAGKQQTGAMKSGFGLNVVVSMIAFDYGIRFIDFTPQEARLAVLGDGRPKDPKAVAMRFCQERGWQIWNHDHADAEIVREAGMLRVFGRGRGALAPRGAFDGRQFWKGGLI